MSRFTSRLARWGGAASALAVLLTCAQARAQESHRFDEAALAARYELPVYDPKAKVVDREVIESEDEFERSRTAVYLVRDDLKRVLAFYTQALGPPRQERDDLGRERYVFTRSEPRSNRALHRVKVRRRRSAGAVEVTLFLRHYASAADVDR